MIRLFFSADCRLPIADCRLRWPMVLLVPGADEPPDTGVTATPRQGTGTG
ncbi:hypothetical protein [Streptomyces erythrochromogenes]